MSPEGSVPQDRGFKALFSTYAPETIACFVPELVRSRGMPREVEALLQHEVPQPDLREPSRFLDTALIATFASGRAIVLLEHWSDRWSVDPARIAMSSASR